MYRRKRQFRTRKSAKPVRKPHFTRARSYGREEKLKLIKEFESLGAPVGMFCKWYGVGVITFKRWQENFFKYGEQGLENHRAGRVGVPEDIAAMVYFLISKESGFITGQNYVIDGGMTRKMIYV